MYNEVELLNGLINRDIDAFSYLYSTRRKWLYSIAMGILKDEFASQDLVQELFVSFWEKNSFEKINTSVDKYLAKSIKHLALNEIVKIKRSNERKNTFSPTMERHAFIDIEGKEISRTFNLAFDKLRKNAPIAAETFSKYHLENRSQSEIATTMAIDERSVRNGVHFAVKMLRSHLQFWRSE